MQEERRLSKRISAKVITNCIKSGTETQTIDHFLSFTKDISLQGACLITSKEMQQGERIAVVLELPTYFMPVLVYGEVAWARDTSKLGISLRHLTEAGVRFLRMEEFDNKKLEDFLKFKEHKAHPTPFA